MESNFIKRIEYEQSQMAIDFVEPKVFSSENSKTEYSIRALIGNCKGATSECKAKCYALRGNIARPSAIMKAVRVQQGLLELGPQYVAEKVATEIPYKSLFRFCDAGDFTKELVQMANILVEIRQDLLYCAYTRLLWAVKELDYRTGIVFSIDHTSIDLIPKVDKSKARIAYMKLFPDEVIPKEVDIIHPVNKRSSLIGDKKDCYFSVNPGATCRDCLRCFYVPDQQVERAREWGKQ